MHVRARVNNRQRNKQPSSAHRKLVQGYAPLLNAFNTFFQREMYGRIRDIFNRPIASTPGAHVDVIERYARDVCAVASVCRPIHTPPLARLCRQ